MSGETCHSKSKLQGSGLSIATEGSAATFSIVLKDSFDNFVEIDVGSLLFTASARDENRMFKASLQHLFLNSCTDGKMGCVTYVPKGSGSFQMQFATGLKEIGLVATYFSDLNQSIALASTFGLTEICVNGNPFTSQPEFAIRWSGFVQKPAQSTVTFSSVLVTQYESVTVWIDNVLILAHESIGSITMLMTFEETISFYEIEVFYTKRASSSTFGFSFSSNQMMTYSNSFGNAPSRKVDVISFRSQLLAFSPSFASASILTIITIFGFQFSSSCNYKCTWTDDLSLLGPIKSAWQVLVNANMLLCGTPSSTAFYGRTALVVVEKCGQIERLLMPSIGLKISNTFLFQSKVLHCSLHKVFRSQRSQISPQLMLSGAVSIFDANTACIVYGRSSSSDAEDYHGPFSVNSGIASQKMDNSISCDGFGIGEWNGVGHVAISVEDSLSAVAGSASILLSGWLCLQRIVYSSKSENYRNHHCVFYSELCVSCRFARDFWNVSSKWSRFWRIIDHSERKVGASARIFLF
jgi:hypothetical protein